MLNVNYNHDSNSHSLLSPQIILAHFFAATPPSSVLDVGCGKGVWLKAALEAGAKDVIGIDGVAIDPAQLHFPANFFSQIDLSRSWRLKRRFDLVICLEVAEHLDKDDASILIDSIVEHSDLVLFSAASPSQPGQHHCNCQWPEYWQSLFNLRGFTCNDDIRWRVWSDPRVEPWYRQNIFVAERDIVRAGTEPRIPAVWHPDAWWLGNRDYFQKQFEGGLMPGFWYLSCLVGALASKIKRRLRGNNTSF